KSDEVEAQPAAIEEAPAPVAEPAAQPAVAEAAPVAEPEPFAAEETRLEAAPEAFAPEATRLDAAPEPFAAEETRLEEREPVAAEPFAPEATRLEPQDEPAAEEEEPDVRVGAIAVPRSLFSIYLGEAEQHVAVLDAQMAAIEADALHPVGADFMRAAHTLASTSRTTGFEAIADVAHALERWLQEAMEVPPEFDAHRLAITRRAVDALVAMVQSVRGFAAPFPRQDVVAELVELHEH